MEIVVSDTNILIDLYNSDLLKYCKYLQLEFRTLDFVIAEITVSSQRLAIQKLIDDEILKVVSLNVDQVASVYRKVAYFAGKCNLSVVDIAVLVYAKDNKWWLHLSA